LASRLPIQLTVEYPAQLKVFGPGFPQLTFKACAFIRRGRSQLFLERIDRLLEAI
jgi:hypothetical protein